MKVSVVVPVFNEETSIPHFHQVIRSLHGLHDDFTVEVVFVNDGSSDNTQAVISALQQRDPDIVLINFVRNFGKEAALFAGLKHASGDAVIPMDVDLQEPVSLIAEMIAQWRQGADVVLARRADRRSDSVFKRVSAKGYYRVYNLLSPEKIESNVGDFRLLSRKTVQEIVRLPERTLFMKGLMNWVGGKTAIIEYQRALRVNGNTKFSARKLWCLGLDGIISFSTVPIRAWTYIGLCIATGAVFYGFWVMLSKLIWGNSVPGYASVMTALLFLGGVQLIGIGVLGEYISRIFIETKKRPRYIIESITPDDLTMDKDDNGQ